MRRIQRILWIVGVTVTIFLNLVGAMPRMYKGVRSRVGSDLVSVHALTGASEMNSIPVMKWDRPDPNDTQGKFVETGEKVEVRLDNAYKDDQIVFYPRVTLCVLGATILLVCAINVASRIAGTPNAQ
jgi:hypothetical protein